MKHIESRIRAETRLSTCKACSPITEVKHYVSNGNCVRCSFEHAEKHRQAKKAQVRELEAALEAACKKIAEQREIIATLNALINSNTKPTPPDLLGDLDG